MSYNEFMHEGDDAIDRTRLRYVLYARKSTVDEKRQVRSIPDQIDDCKRLAEAQGLNIVDVIEENGSAKTPNKRPLFDKMLSDVVAKKYDGIICWHPDRLCRNMLEGGRVLNMLDDSTIKDLAFNSHQFVNNASGKLLLGMLFVFSKHYSDDLSEKSLRGVRKSFKEGKSAGTPKWGYTISKVSKRYERNRYFNDIKQAWDMRSAEDTASLEEIVSFLKSKDVHRVTGDGKRVELKIASLSKMFQDPFAYGMLVQAGQTADLRELYGFEPLVDEATYNKVQVISHGRTKDKRLRKRVAFYPLRRFVYCGTCNGSQPMSVGRHLVGNKGHHQLRFTCKNEGCPRSPKSVGASVVVNNIYDTLGSVQISEEAYRMYSEAIDSVTAEKIVSIKEEIRSHEGALKHIVSELEQRALKATNLDTDSEIYKANTKRIDSLSQSRDELSEKMENLKAKIEDPNKIKLNKANVLNLLKTLPDKMRAGSAVEKDVLSRILWLNLRLNRDNTLVYLWNEPFKSLLQYHNFASGGDGRN